MASNPFLGVLFHATGGFAAGTFYTPLKKVRRWAWESYWLVMGLAAWLAAPWIVARLTTPELLVVLRESPPAAMRLAMFFGVLWGIGNLTFGLSVRYLGMALGYAIALGFCAAFGTLVPPIVDGTFGSLVTTGSGRMILSGVIICLAGIGICGWAGVSKERELTEEAKRTSVAEFSLIRGFIVAFFSGLLSACFAFGLKAGEPIAKVSEDLGTDPLYVNNAVLVVILIGGFASNAFWCLYLNWSKGTFRDYWQGSTRRQVINYALSATGGVIWYGQFFFYGMGSTKLGDDYKFSSWTLHMAFIIIFSNLWGLYFREWRGTSRRTTTLVWTGIIMLILSTIIIGLGRKP